MITFGRSAARGAGPSPGPTHTDAPLPAALAKKDAGMRNADTSRTITRTTFLFIIFA